MRKHQMFLTALSLSLLFACGEKEPPPTVSDAGGLTSGLDASGGFEPIEPIADDTTSGIEPAPDFVEGDDFVDDPIVDEPVVEEPVCENVAEDGSCLDVVEEEPVCENVAEDGSCLDVIEEEPVCENVAEDGSCADVIEGEPATEPTPEPTVEPTPEPTPTPAPTTPETVSISNATASSFTIDWNSVTDADYYKVYVNGSLSSSDITGTTHTVTGLTPNTSYSVTVSAVTDDGEQAQSDSVSATTSAIGAPQGLKANTIGGSSVSISWNSVSDATEYKVYLNGSLKQSGITSPNAVVSGLTAETAYSISVSAVTSAGESAQSSALSVTTIDPYGNKRLGFLQVPAMESMDGLEIKNNHAYIGHFVNPGFFSSNKRYVRDFNLSSGQYQDIQISTTGDVKITGVGVSGSYVFTSTYIWDDDDKNFYRNVIGSTSQNRFPLGTSSTTFKDLAVDDSSGAVYISSGTYQSVVKLTPHPENPNAYLYQYHFTGATNIDPLGLDLDSSGNVYVFDGISKDIIKYNKADGSEMLRFPAAGISGQGESYGAAEDLAIDTRNGDIYVVGNGSTGVKIFRYDSTGKFLRSFGDAELTSPKKMAIDSAGKIYVIDSVKKGVLVFDVGTKP